MGLEVGVLRIATCFLHHALALPAELLAVPTADGAPAAWAALPVCWTGLLRAGILLDPLDDFGLELDIRPDLSIPTSFSSLDEP